MLLLWSKGGGDSFKRLSDHWLPELRRMGVLVPIILVGARKDLGPDLKKQMLHQVRGGRRASQAKRTRQRPKDPRATAGDRPPHDAVQGG